MAQAKKTGKGPRPKHVPQRTCITCRRVDAKRGLVRLVRDTDGRVTIDTTGKRTGRGAYLCHDPACWSQALKRQGLQRALRVDTLHPDDVATLNQFSAQLAEQPEPSQGETDV